MCVFAIGGYSVFLRQKFYSSSPCLCLSLFRTVAVCQCATDYYRPAGGPIGQCRPCSDQCEGGCSGPGADQCFACKSVLDGSICRDACPSGKYENNGTCATCSAACFSDCSGPGRSSELWQKRNTLICSLSPALPHIQFPPPPFFFLSFFPLHRRRDCERL